VLLKLFEHEIEGTLAKEDGAGGMIEDHSIERPPHGEFEDESPSKLTLAKEVKPEEPIDILYLNPSTPLEQAKSTLEFVVLSLC